MGWRVTMDHGSRTAASVPAMTASGLRFASFFSSARAATTPGLRGFARSRAGGSLATRAPSRPAPAPLPLVVAALTDQNVVKGRKGSKGGMGGARPLTPGCRPTQCLGGA